VKRSSEYVTLSTLQECTDAWLSEIHAHVAPRPWLSLKPRRCCLIVIDMLHYFAHPSGRCYLPATAAIVPRIKALLQAWRKHGKMIVYTQHCHEGGHDLGMLGRFFSDYIRAGAQEAELLQELAPHPGENVVRKTTYDAFMGTDLQEMLRENEIEQVLVTGVLTHMCCETSARSAFCRGFEVYVAADGTASSSEERHVGSLLSMADSVAVIMNIAEILDRCR
jgi:bifunctional isochorismate lyase/aryl carrier protein